MQPGEGVNITIHLDETDARILFLLAIHSDQSLEDVLLGMMEEATSDLASRDIQQPKVLEAIAEYKQTGLFDPAKWREQA